MKAKGPNSLVLLCVLALASTPTLLRPQSPAESALDPVDFRYSPPWWQTSICLPDDPDKALVGREGQLLFDYCGGFADLRKFAVALQPGIAGRGRWLRQAMVSARVPIIQTWSEADGVEVSEETFIVTPGPGVTVASPRLSRVDSQNMMYGWAKPARESSPAFADCALDDRDPIHFQLAVAPGARVTVVYGLCEGRFTEPRARQLVLSAEGSETRTVDPVKDFGANQPGIYKLEAYDANHDGVIDIYAGTPAGAGAHEAVLNALWVFSGAVPADDAIIAGRADSSALASFPAILQPSRRAVVLMTLRNPSAETATRRPELRIRSAWPVTQSQADHGVYLGSGTRISGSLPLTLASAEAAGEYCAQMPALALPPGGSRDVVFMVDRHSSGPAGAPNADQAHTLRAAAIQWWTDYGLPYAAIEVPDPSIQELLDSCVRNIWQARELKIDGPAFQVGPTVYRGLWVVDGSFLLETAAILGRGRDARSGLEYLLRRQRPDGSFELIDRYWKENGIVLWAATRHALLTQDKDWLRAHWPALQRVMGAIRRMRDEASGDPRALNYRLLPGGDVDGGINNKTVPEYSNIYWTLAGMKSFISAAHWLGDEAGAAASQKEYDDFYAVFRRACARDTLRDEHGNAYVPTMMGNAGKYVAQKGQWAFCHAVYPGQVFPENDPLVEGQLAMLCATKTEGMVLDTGWMTGGIWTYFASFYWHAQLWQGRGREAAQSLYAFARHACPMRVWREEQKPIGRGSDEVGDMPHNWASAEFIRLATHLIELDRGDELHLLEGFPREWAGPGMVTRLDGVLTPFGPLRLEICVAGDGRSARVKMRQLTGSRPARVMLHLDGLAGKSEPIELPVDRDVEQSVAFGMRAQ
ncbi:MAG TPA: hypothetical protein VN775_10660 [Opitutaceae bacterium]|nr:hypothetical protein [Opitutaceae bacterium]